jgi:hypothetical protein
MIKVQRKKILTYYTILKCQESASDKCNSCDDLRVGTMELHVFYYAFRN